MKWFTTIKSKMFCLLFWRLRIWGSAVKKTKFHVLVDISCASITPFITYLEHHTAQRDRNKSYHSRPPVIFSRMCSPILKPFLSKVFLPGLLITLVSKSWMNYFPFKWGKSYEKYGCGMLHYDGFFFSLLLSHLVTMGDAFWCLSSRPNTK
jgi:hypothetical protein